MVLTSIRTRELHDALKRRCLYHWVDHPDLERALPSPTRGEGVLEAEFDSYRPVTGPPPSRPRTDDNPLDRKEYLLHVNRRV